MNSPESLPQANPYESAEQDADHAAALAMDAEFNNARTADAMHTLVDNVEQDDIRTQQLTHAIGKRASFDGMLKEHNFTFADVQSMGNNRNEAIDKREQYEANIGDGRVAIDTDITQDELHDIGNTMNKIITDELDAGNIVASTPKNPGVLDSRAPELSSLFDRVAESKGYKVHANLSPGKLRPATAEEKARERLLIKDRYRRVLDDHRPEDMQKVAARTEMKQRLNQTMTMQSAPYVTRYIKEGEGPTSLNRH